MKLYYSTSNVQIPNANTSAAVSYCLLVPGRPKNAKTQAINTHALVYQRYAIQYTKYITVCMVLLLSFVCGSLVL